jgi:hypothetical protein
VPLVEVAVIATIIELIWCAYWIRSRRVLDTFGRRGLDLFARPGPSLSAPRPSTRAPA